MKQRSAWVAGTAIAIALSLVLGALVWTSSGQRTGPSLGAEPLFWTASNPELPGATLEWWAKQQSQTPDAVQKTVQKALPGLLHLIPKPSVSLKKDRTCAVVGNSGNLTKARYGRAIDRHDLVFRMNKAPTDGYESDVGTRTTHHFLYPQSAAQKHFDPKSTVLFVARKPTDLAWLRQQLSAMEQSPFSGMQAEQFRIVHPAWIRKVHQEWNHSRGEQPSTGLVAIATALRYCERASVFGFGAAFDGRWDLYYDLKAGKADGGFAKDQEAVVRTSLERQGLIEVYPGYRPTLIRSATVR